MFPIPSTLWLKIGAIVIALGFAYYKGYSGEHEKFVKFQAEVEAVGKAQEQLNASLVEKHELVSTSIKDEYEARIAAVRNYYANRVQSNPSGGKVSTVSNTTLGTNATADNAIFIGQCAEVTQQLVSLQKWIQGIK